MTNRLWITREEAKKMYPAADDLKAGEPVRLGKDGRVYPILSPQHEPELTKRQK